MARRGNPARLVIALSVGAVLAIFILYTSAFAHGTPALQPSQLPGHSGTVDLGGKVVGPVTGNAHDTPLRFRLRDRSGTVSVPVSYEGTVPDLFKIGREVIVTGTMQNGVFAGAKDSLVTKCPSKYQPAQKTSS
ncbi:MAG: cytochrome c maturation protein CcmE domain-containing protein [Gaiellaceae bacterium]